MKRLLMMEVGVQDDIIVESGNVVVSNATTTASAGAISSSGGGGGAVNSLESLPIDLIPLDDDDVLS